MSLIVQLYKDKKKTIKAYPKSLACETYMSDEMTTVEDILNDYLIKNAQAYGEHIGTSVNRPEKASRGQMHYDSELNKPIWFDGDQWRDANGNIV